jgi:hypothetical protein
MGDAWLAAGELAMLMVPSALAPDTENHLLNPAHADVQRERIRIIDAAHSAAAGRHAVRVICCGPLNACM